MLKDYSKLKKIIQEARNKEKEEDITIADVMIALEKISNKNCWYSISDSGNIYVNSNYTVVMSKTNWNLLDDNLDNQSDKTKQFLIDILVKRQLS